MTICAQEHMNLMRRAMHCTWQGEQYTVHGMCIYPSSVMEQLLTISYHADTTSFSSRSHDSLSCMYSLWGGMNTGWTDCIWDGQIVYGADRLYMGQTDKRPD